MPIPAEPGPVAADRLLAHRDRAIPGLALALDDAALSAWLAQRWVGPGELVGARVTYVRYKPATALIAAVDVHTADGTVPALGRFVAPGGLGKLQKLEREATRRPGPFEPVVDVASGAAVAPLTADRELPGIVRLLGPARHPARVLRYKPERRLVAQVGSGSAARLVKAYRRGEAGAMAARHRAVASSGLAVPAVLEVDSDAALIATEWVEGVSLDAAAGGDVAACGALAAGLHRADVAGLPPAPALVAVLADSVGAVAALVPDAADAADAIASGVLDSLAGAGSAPLVPVHGDLSADQGLRRPDGALVLVDLDRASVDDPAADLASFVAASLAAGGPDVDADAIVAGLLDGHTAAGGPDVAGRLGPRIAAAVLQRAVEPFRYRRPDWEGGVRHLLAAAGTALMAGVRT